MKSKSQFSALHAILLATLLGTWGVMVPRHVQADEKPDASTIVDKINAVPDGEFVTRKLTMIMTDRNGTQRQQESITYRKYFGKDKKNVLFFTSPANIKGTGFLNWNYADPQHEDDQWLFLPALRKVRRIPTADRGDYFLGTDFTYEDMKLDGKMEPLDYTFVLVGEENVGEIAAYKLQATPKDEKTAQELGYSKTVSWVDPKSWTLVKVDFYDTKDALLKTLKVEDSRQVNGFWTRHRLTMQNHQTGHQTEMIFSNVDYVTPVSDEIFSVQALPRGQ